MIKVFILSAQLAGGFTMIPFSDEIACNDAIDALPPSIVTEAECYPVEMIQQSGSRLAPEMAPLPPHKPGQGV